MNVTISELAWEDIRRNVGWWSENRSEAQAAAWYNDIRATIASLSDLPEQWPLAREASHFSYVIREYHLRASGRATHRIVFSVGDNDVVVIRVVHVKQQDIDPEDHPNPH